MADAKSGVVHTEVMELTASPAQVREFIMTPERILDYFPDPIDGGVLEPGHAIYCRGQMGVSMLERIESECSDDCVVVKVSTAFGLEAPYTRERIEAGTVFTMVEDWEVAASAGGTTLTKTWRDIETRGELPMDMAEAVREGAKHETVPLVAGWNAATEA